MKNLRLLFTLLFVAAFASLSFGQNITGSAHDFSAQGWNGSGEICIVCHTPHNADVINVTSAPLWNHEVTAATFTTYTSSTLDADAGTLGQPDNESLLCLSCHDGTVALGSFGGVTGTGSISAGNDLGTDLSDDHPISFVYNSALSTADGGLLDPSSDVSGITPAGTIDDDMLFEGRMECASCHNVHDDTYGNFLILSNAASALCLTCHDK